MITRFWGGGGVPETGHKNPKTLLALLTYLSSNSPCFQVFMTELHGTNGYTRVSRGYWWYFSGDGVILFLIGLQFGYAYGSPVPDNAWACLCNQTCIYIWTNLCNGTCICCGGIYSFAPRLSLTWTWVWILLHVVLTNIILLGMWVLPSRVFSIFVRPRATFGFAAPGTGHKNLRIPGSSF